MWTHAIGLMSLTCLVLSGCSELKNLLFFGDGGYTRV